MPIMLPNDPNFPNTKDTEKLPELPSINNQPTVKFEVNAEEIRRQIDETQMQIFQTMEYRSNQMRLFIRCAGAAIVCSALSDYFKSSPSPDALTYFKIAELIEGMSLFYAVVAPINMVINSLMLYQQNRKLEEIKSKR